MVTLAVGFPPTHIIVSFLQCDIKKAKSKNESRGGGRGGFRGGRGGFFPGKKVD